MREPVFRQVMVVDDSDTDLLYVGIVVETLGLAEAVLPFGSALDALAHLQRPDSARVDLVLLDINMPEMSGFEFLDRYQPLFDSGQAHAGVVMLTSSPEADDKARARSYRCVRGYLIKPLDPDTAGGLAALATPAPPR